MTISEAALIGCADTYKAEGTYFDFAHQGDRAPCKACYWGAVYIGLFGADMDRWARDKAMWEMSVGVAIATGAGVDITGETIPYPPGVASPTARTRASLYDMGVYLNDVAGWSREEIAAYFGERGY